MENKAVVRSVCSLSGVNGCWELLQARAGSQELQHLKSDLDDITSWLRRTLPELETRQRSDRAADLEDLRARAKELRVRLRSEGSRSAESRVPVYT